MSITFHQHLSFFRKYGIRVGKLRSAMIHAAGNFHREIAQLDVIFVDDDTLLQMNKDFLDHDYFTDIITFDLGSEATSIVGELYISQDRILDNAQTLSTEIPDEILRVCIHGLLHLCGMNDSSEEEKLAMRTAENTYIQFYKTND